MNSSSKITSTFLAIVLLAPTIAYARPSFRSIRTEGKGQVDAAKDAKLKSMKEGMQTVYERRDDSQSGISVLIPKDWKPYRPGGKMTMYFRELKEGKTLVGFRKHQLEELATMDYIDRLFKAYVRQPTNETELAYLPFIHEYKLITSDTILVGGMSAREYTYSFVYESTHWQQRDIFIPHGDSIILLLYRNPINIFEQDLSHFKKLVDSLILKKKSSSSTVNINRKNSRSSSSISPKYIKTLRNSSSSAKSQSRSSSR